MKKRAFLVSVFVAFLLVAVSAANAANAGDYSLTFSTRVLSRYVSSSSGAVFSDRPVSQSEMFVTMPNKGLWFHVWLSKGLGDTDFNYNYSNEVDYGVGWTGKLKEAKVTIGIYYYDMIKTFQMPSGDIYSPFLEISKDFSLASGKHTFAPYGRFEYFLPVDRDKWSGTRTFSHVGLRHIWKISSKWGVSQQARGIYDSGGLGGAEHTILGMYSLAVNWCVAESLTVNPLAYTFSTPLSAVSDGRAPQNIIGMGISYVFK